MRRTAFSVLLAALLLGAGQDAHGQVATLDIRDGRVTLDARNVSVTEILARWRQVGGVTVESQGPIPSLPMTLYLTNVTEREAWAVLLRDVGGYILGSRPDGTGGPATINRVVILPASAPVSNAGAIVAPERETQGTGAPPFFPSTSDPSSVAAEYGQRFFGVSGAGPGPGATQSSVTSPPMTWAPSGASPQSAQGPSASPFAPTPSRPRVTGSATDAIPPEALPPDPTQRQVPQNPFGIQTGSSQPGTLAPVPLEPYRPQPPPAPPTPTEEPK
jgi:hypothetical protein